MLNTPMDVLTQFPVRKSGNQKQAFRAAVQSYAENLGYSCTVEEGSFGSRNLVIGEPAKAKYLVTANYDTGFSYLIPDYMTPCNPLLAVLGRVLLFGLYGLAVGTGCALILALFGLLFGVPFRNALALGLIISPVPVFLVGFVLIPVILMLFTSRMENRNCNTSGVVTLLEILRTLPENQRHKVCFALFDMAEQGWIGSNAYRKAHPESSSQMVVHLNCVGDGDNLLLMPGSKLKKDGAAYRKLFKCCGYFGSKSLLVQEKGRSMHWMDYFVFPQSVGISAFRKTKKGMLYSRIHHAQDVHLDETNVNILRAAVTTLICSDAAQ